VISYVTFSYIISNFEFSSTLHRVKSSNVTIRVNHRVDLPHPRKIWYCGLNSALFYSLHDVIGGNKVLAMSGVPRTLN
jgi:hypothetical protein